LKGKIEGMRQNTYSNKFSAAHLADTRYQVGNKR
jgi:hypothetical protein